MLQQPTIYPVTSIGTGSLNIMAKPVAGEGIDDEFSGIAKFGIERLVCLLERPEMLELGLRDEPQLCHKFGIEFIHFPIIDMTLPPSLPAYIKLVTQLYADCLRGSHSVIHCRAGIGRTGMVAAGLLIRHGFTTEAAFEYLSAARTISMPDTEEQKNWVLTNQQLIAA